MILGPLASPRGPNFPGGQGKPPYPCCLLRSGRRAGPGWTGPLRRAAPLFSLPKSNCSNKAEPLFVRLGGDVRTQPPRGTGEGWGRVGASGQPGPGEERAARSQLACEYLEVFVLVLQERIHIAGQPIKTYLLYLNVAD